MEKIFIAEDKKKYFLCDDKSLLKPKDVIGLYASVNWGKKDDYKISEIKKTIKNTSILYFVIDENKKLVGLIRAISDFVYSTYISDIIVHPEHQRNGIGEMLVNAVIMKTKSTPIFLHSYGKSEKFFSKCGLKYKHEMKVFTSKK